MNTANTDYPKPFFKPIEYNLIYSQESDAKYDSWGGLTKDSMLKNE